jgi:hypothetical protein
MSGQLLREYLSLVVERIRTKRGVKGGRLGDRFDLKRFKALAAGAGEGEGASVDVLNAYASRYLQKLGEGSSRAAYVLGSKYALKVAVNKKGLAQNQAEMDVYTNPTSQPIVARVYSADPGFAWLVSDLVKPLADPAEFKQLTGADWQAFASLLDQNAVRNRADVSKQPKFVQSVIATARANELLEGDLSEIGHWGKTPDGRCVLLDYGFTSEVHRSHYSSKKQATHPEDRTARTAAPKKKAPVGNGTEDVDPVKDDDVELRTAR